MKTGFQNRLSGTTSPGGKWVLNTELIYYTSRGVRFTIPANFETDLASIPWFMRWLFPVNDDHRESATLHDRLYRRKGKMIVKKMSRLRCDYEFLIAMKSQGVSTWKRWGMFVGVAAFGWWVWHDCSKRIRKFFGLKSA